MPTLGYWKTRGLGQPIRLLLHYVGEEFEDLRFQIGEGPTYSREAWFSKKYSYGLGFPNLPFYIDGDVKITMSNAIIMYIGRKYDMVGKSESERILVDILLNLQQDIARSTVMMSKNPRYDELKGDFFSSMTKQRLPLLEKHLENGDGWFVGESDELKGDFFSSMTKQRLPLLEKHLENGDGWFVGESVTVVDFPLYEILDHLRTLKLDILVNFPKLNDFMCRMEALPAIKKYMGSDNFIKSPFHNP